MYGLCSVHNLADPEKLMITVILPEGTWGTVLNIYRRLSKYFNKGERKWQ